MIADAAPSRRPRPASLPVAAILVAALLLTGCAWESARGPGSDADPEEVDRMLVALIGPTLDDPELAENPPTAITDGVAALAQEHPRHIGAQWAAAVFARHAGNDELARLHLDRVLTIDPTHVGAAVMAASLAVEAGNLPRARKIVDTARRAHPDASNLHETASWLAKLDGEPGTALADLDRALELGAPEWRVAYNRGLILEDMDDQDGAATEYERCLGLREDFEPARARLRALQAR